MILNLPYEAKWYLNDGSDCYSSVAIDKSQVYHLVCLCRSYSVSLSLPKAHVSHIVRIVSVRMSELKILRKDWRTSNCLFFLLFHTSRHLLRLEESIYIYVYKHFNKLCSKSWCIKSFSFFCSRLIRVLTNDRHH